MSWVSLSLHEKHGIGCFATRRTGEQEHIKLHDNHIACKILSGFPDFFQSCETKSRTESQGLSIDNIVQTSILYHLWFEGTVITWLWTSNDKISSHFRNEWSDKNNSTYHTSYAGVCTGPHQPSQLHQLLVDPSWSPVDPLGAWHARSRTGGGDVV